jgi:transcriptional regulator with XRE-family HTH domain
MRDSKALSLSEVAERTGLSVSVIWSLETGRRLRPHPKTLRLLAECYEVTPDEVRAAFAGVAA